MSGMHVTTGRRLDGLDHIRQSIRDILTTPVGSRVMRRDYGSLIPELIDHPVNPANQLRLNAATVMAVARWEPRVSLTRVAFSLDGAGKVTVDLEGVTRSGPRTGAPVSLAIAI